MIRASFHSFARAGGWNAFLASPAEVRTATRLPEVLPLIRFADESARRGSWVALLLSYEAAPAFDAALATHPAGSFPLAWAAVFDEAAVSTPPPAPSSIEPLDWQPLVSPADYKASIERIRAYIARGDTYQVNYTFPLRGHFHGDAPAWFHRLGPAQAAPYSAFVDLGRFQVLSFSPELFFEWRDGRLTSRPMKGTGTRGRWFEEDRDQARALARSRKDRAENLMIADMVRNDLGRIARFGSVRVPRLFEVERYPTLYQMTSTVEATPRDNVALVDVLRALFPGASITGAPKVRTMQIIRELEPHPRGLYTGAIGLLKPGGEAEFSISIRTVVVDRPSSEAVFHVGGGVTWDSTAGGEYDECLLKATFLSESAAPFSLLETMRLENGEYFLLERHLERLRQTACYFDYPMDEGRIRLELGKLAGDRGSGAWKTRLQLDSTGRITLDIEPLVSRPQPWKVALADSPVNSRNRFLYHKTTRRAVYEHARAAQPGYDDILLWNERGEMTESCLANIVVVRGGRKVTPPRSCGLLPGVFRQELLDNREVTERVIRREEVRRAEALFLINSVRGWIPADLRPAEGRPETIEIEPSRT